MNWSVTTIIPIIASAIYGGILLAVIFSAPINRLRRIFIVYLLAMLVWSVSAFMTVSGLVDVFVWFKVMTAAPLVMMVSIFYFVQSLFAWRRKITPYVLWYGVIVIAVLLFTGFVVHQAYLDENQVLVYEFSNLVILIAGPGYGLMVYSLVELVRAIQDTDNHAQRNRLRYLAIGLSITIIASVVNFTPWGQYPIDIAANGLTAILIAYAILRHQLLEIRVVIRLGLLYSITTTIFGAIYYLIIYLSMDLFRIVSGGNIFSISLIIAILTAIVLTPMRNQTQTWIDRIFYRERYNASLMLRRLSEATASLLDLEEITKLILDEVTGTLHIQHAAIFVRRTQTGIFRLLAGHNLTPLAPKELREDHPVTAWLSKRSQVLTKHEMSNLPAFRALWDDERIALETLSMNLYIPLQAKGELVGMLTVGPKKSTQPYTPEDQLTLITLGNQMAVAIENARLYEELETTFVETVVALANAIDLRDAYTSDHSEQIAVLAADTAKVMDLPEREVEAVYWGGLLHDIGKIGIPDSILQKPAKLNEEEWAVIRTHPKIGADLVAKVNKLGHISPIIEYSHERYNGSGYPYGAKGEEIPIGARIVGVVDSYSAMTDRRVYKEPLSHEDAIIELKQNSGILFDPDVLTAFFKVIGNGDQKAPEFHLEFEARMVKQGQEIS
ncbi:MAG: HD domain-containing protein [Anaerolineales bacterium]|jgi:HD-GYP domain-containing protein (c-di-GMP phosphodiesterase class II)